MFSHDNRQEIIIVSGKTMELVISVQFLENFVKQAITLYLQYKSRAEIVAVTKNYTFAIGITIGVK